jgi:hypothetical protein
MAHETRLPPAGLVVDHLQDLVLKTDDVKEMLDELAEFSAVTLADPAIAFCCITLIQPKKSVTVASSEDSAVRLDETQYSAGDGPCLSAIRQQRVVPTSLLLWNPGPPSTWRLAPSWRRTAASRRRPSGS